MPKLLLVCSLLVLLGAQLGRAEDLFPDEPDGDHPQAVDGDERGDAALADDNPPAGPEPAGDLPKSRAALQALAKRDRTIQTARAAYLRAVQAARRESLSGLEQALKAAMKAGDLDEANRIS